MASLGPPDLDQETPGNPITLVNWRTDEVKSVRLTIRHIVKTLEGECPLCGHPLGMAIRPVDGESTQVARCDRCWLDYIPRMEQGEESRDWHLDILERDAPFPADPAEDVRHCDACDRDSPRLSWQVQVEEQDGAALWQSVCPLCHSPEGGELIPTPGEPDPDG